MTQEPLDDQVQKADSIIEALRLEVEKLKQEEEKIRFLRQEKEDQLRSIIFRNRKNR